MEVESSFQVVRRSNVKPLVAEASQYIDVEELRHGWILLPGLQIFSRIFWPERRSHLLYAGGATYGTVRGGEGGIRTHVTIARKHAFQACSFSHSDTSPRRLFNEVIQYHGRYPDREITALHPAGSHTSFVAWLTGEEL